MKILQVNKFYYPWLGGVESIVKDLAEGLTAKGHTVDVLCAGTKKRSCVDTVEGIRVYRTASFGIIFRTSISFAFFIKWRTLRNQYDVLALHHPSPLTWLAYLLFPPKSSVRTVVHYHSDIIKQSLLGRLFRPLIMHMLRGSDSIVVSNQNMIDSSDILQHVTDKCTVIPFGVSVDVLEALVDKNLVTEITEEYGRFLLFVGRLRYYKGVHVLFDAIKDTDIPLVFIGTGEEELMLREHIESHNLMNQITILPSQPRRGMMSYMKAAHAFVLPSIVRSETFGIVLLEALAVGTPCISTEIGTGTSFVNKDGYTGLVVPPSDSAALRSAIQKLWSDSDVYQQYAVNTKQHVQQLFTYDAMITAAADIYSVSTH